MGWINLGEYNNEIDTIERDLSSDCDIASSVANHILVFMVRGIGFPMPPKAYLLHSFFH